ncbi:MAG: DUF3306 domain-containing protein [Xanthobacteraceae bacterium]
MSDQEGFLTRWSRRKREVEQAASEEPPTGAAPNEETVPAERDEADAPPASAPPAEEQQQESAVDLASLPPIESITAGTDIRAFLAPGIPAYLTRAALRRAWVADPAIRDFVGLAENAWDFNAPDAVPGFGSVLPPQEAQRLIAELMRSDDRVSSPESQPEPPQKPGIGAPDETPSSPPAVTAVPVADATGRSPVEQSRADAALQKEEATDDRPAGLARHHGGALPH